MRVLWNIHLYFPDHCCGSERMAHEINKYLISKGHEVRVVLNQAVMHNVKVPYTFEGVVVDGPKSTVDQYMWADVICTHLDFSAQTIQICNIIGKPVINFVHNSHRYNCVESARKNNYVVYNSDWIAKELNYRWPAMTFNPPCDYRFYDLGKDSYKNEYITLINLDENKGGWIFEKLAKAMPDKKFLAVTGSYSEPMDLGQNIRQPGNVKVIPKQVDIRNVYEQTRILLMLSRYESWGMTATEAMANGIPVICTPTPGLQENCGEAGIYIPGRGKIIRSENGKLLTDDRNSYDINPLINQIKKLDQNKKYYKTISELCRARSRQHDPQLGLPKLEDFLIRACRETRGKEQNKQSRPITMI